MLGAVVVGVGTAGAVRIRDMLAPVVGTAAEQLQVRGFVSRRTLDLQQGVSQISMEEALSRDDIHVAFICLENVCHEDAVRKFLQAGKHVCVEYPMTLKHSSAVELYELAQRKGLILHEEHIELLSEDYKLLKKQVEDKVLKEGSLHFTGGRLNPGFGSVVFSGVARLTWLVDLFGALTVTGATLEEDGAKGFTKMTAALLTANNTPLTWIEERQPGLARAKKVCFHFDSTSLTQTPSAPRGPVGLFMQDLIKFSSKVCGGVSLEELQQEKERVLHCLHLAENIQQRCSPV